MKPSVIVWDLETVPDLSGFAAANDLVGKSDVEVRRVAGFVGRCYYPRAQPLAPLHLPMVRAEVPVQVQRSSARSHNELPVVRVNALLPAKIGASTRSPLNIEISVKIPTGLDCAGLFSLQPLALSGETRC
jgi:hypothetical protein